MTLLLNVLWFVFGGFWSGLSWLLGGVILAITVVGLPWTAAAFRIGMFSFAPFGRQIEPRQWATGRGDLGTGCLGAGLNVLWFCLAGWWIALGHLVIAVAQAITIIGIPFAVQHVKLAGLALAPVGKTITPPL